MIGYMDTSALVKRYAPEKNSELVKNLFQIQNLLLVSSSWIVNEAVAALDKKIAKRQINQGEFDEALKTFFDHLEEASGINKLVLLLVEPYLSTSLDLITKHHISADDALHLASALMVGVDLLIAGDKRLIEAARVEGIESYNVEIDADAQLLRRTLEGASQ